MNALSHARNAYSASATPIRTAGKLEYEAVARITRKLQSAVKLGRPGFGALVEALHDNKKLWTIFAIDVADSNNQLPSELRANLFYLAEFTNQHTSKVLARQATAQPLIEINMSILRGLSKGVA